MYDELVARAELEDRSINGQVLRFIRYGLDFKLVAKYMQGLGWTPPAENKNGKPSDITTPP